MNILAISLLLLSLFDSQTIMEFARLLCCFLLACIHEFCFSVFFLVFLSARTLRNCLLALSSFFLTVLSLFASLLSCFPHSMHLHNLFACFPSILAAYRIVTCMLPYLSTSSLPIWLLTFLLWYIVVSIPAIFFHACLVFDRIHSCFLVCKHPENFLACFIVSYLIAFLHLVFLSSFPIFKHSSNLLSCFPVFLVACLLPVCFFAILVEDILANSLLHFLFS